jgi:hypothetical protein
MNTWKLISIVTPAATSIGVITGEVVLSEPAIVSVVPLMLQPS